ncbi:ARM repeat-containing protein [Trametes versicolor FP-101664 SS1]|uniref:ARM repeat-containing protein n=1 Tax=Trametes versicolor (strain FP-101664) TaxID=717944 RepID=UPI0004622458|nr:ARM repeat-containing protein [Trametes versicolor FP-101664 SS1]EIW64758.1 ARM repeat-containing protein [Trametes versicolor FP-101664 SS1]
MASSASTWTSPPTRPPLIEELVSGVDRYNPSNVNILEDYLYHQIRSQEYDCLANLAILKLYQFNPELYNPDVVINILIKALTSAPFPDFSLCISLLDERPAALSASADEPDPLPQLQPVLARLHALLQQCRFPQFWALYRGDDVEALRDNYTVECVGFEDAVREVAVRAVKAAFTSIGRARLGSYLALDGPELDVYVAKLGWTTDASTGVITVPPNPDNQITSTVVQENIQLPLLQKVITHAAQTSLPLVSAV